MNSEPLSADLTGEIARAMFSRRELLGRGSEANFNWGLFFGILGGTVLNVIVACVIVFCAASMCVSYLPSYELHDAILYTTSLL
jgi:hypothetical protein